MWAILLLLLYGSSISIGLNADELSERFFEGRKSLIEPRLAELYEGNTEYIGFSTNAHRFQNEDRRIDELIEAGYRLANEGKRSDLAMQLWEDVLFLLLFEERKTDEALQAKMTGVIQSIKISDRKKYYLTRDKSSIGNIQYAIAVFYSVQPGMDKKYLKYLNFALKIDECNVEGLLLKSEQASAKTRFGDAMRYLDKAVSCQEPNVYMDTLYRRGQAQFQQKAYSLARKDFARAYLMDSMNADDKASRIIVLHYRGITERLCGDHMEARDTVLQALAMGTNKQQAYQDLATTYKELGDWENSLKYMDLFKRDGGSNAALNNNFEGTVYLLMGKTQETIANTRSCLHDGLEDTQCLLLLALSHQSVGDFVESKRVFDYMLTLDEVKYYVPTETKNRVWTRRESMLYMASRYLSPLLSFNSNNDLERVIIGESSKYHPYLPDRLEYTPYAERPGFVLDPKFEPTAQFNVSVAKILKEVNTYSQWLVLNTTGFFTNQRSLCAFGLGVLQMAQSLNAHVARVRAGKGGLLLPDTRSSNTQHYGFKGCRKDTRIQPLNKGGYHPDCPARHHHFGWRDFFDIFVTFRQLSNPLDTVWWVDRFLHKEHSVDTQLLEGGFKKNHRYYDYFEPAFNLTKRILVEEGYHADTSPDVVTQLPRSKIQAVWDAKNPQELFQAVGQRFYAEVTLRSLMQGEDGQLATLRGGLLIVDGGDEHGFNFGLKFEVGHLRVKLQYEKEINHLFEQLVSALVELDPLEEEATEGLSPQQEIATTAGLQLLYYWVSFAPLTRGSSAAGYAALYACVLSQGMLIDQPIPHKIQLDWEAFFSDNPASFMEKVQFVRQQRPASPTLRHWLFADTDAQTASADADTNVQGAGVVNVDGSFSVDEMVKEGGAPLQVEVVMDSTAAIVHVFSHLDDYQPSIFEKQTEAKKQLT